MLKVWGRKNSINVQKVMWTIGELGIAYERIDAGGPFGGLNDPAFVKMNPMKRVPVIDDAGTIVWESHAIVRYLCAQYGKGRLWAEDPTQRSTSDIWMEWTQANLQSAFINGVFWNFYRTPEAQRDWPAIRQSIKLTADLLRILDRHLADRSFVGGDALTMGDFAPGVQLYRYFNLEIERPSLLNVEAWYERLCSRPTYREHVMIPFDDLRGRLNY
jgi:glutathione S-transferase